MASELNPAEQTISNPGETRRSFLFKLGIGAAAMALAAGALSSVKGVGSGNRASASKQEFPGEDSIFHPAADPRGDPRRNSIS